MYVAPNITGYVGWPDGWSELSLCWPCLCAWLCLWFLKLERLRWSYSRMYATVVETCGFSMHRRVSTAAKLLYGLHSFPKWMSNTDRAVSYSQCWNSPGIHVTFFTVTPYSVIQITNQDFIIQHIVAFSKYSQPRLFADVIPSFSTGGRFSNVCFYEK